MIIYVENWVLYAIISWSILSMGLSIWGIILKYKVKKAKRLAKKAKLRCENKFKDSL